MLSPVTWLEMSLVFWLVTCLFLLLTWLEMLSLLTCDLSVVTWVPSLETYSWLAKNGLSEKITSYSRGFICNFTSGAVGGSSDAECRPDFWHAKVRRDAATLQFSLLVVKALRLCRCLAKHTLTAERFDARSLYFIRKANKETEQQ